MKITNRHRKLANNHWPELANSEYPQEDLAEIIKDSENTLSNTIQNILLGIAIIAMIFLYITGNHIQKEYYLVEICEQEILNLEEVGKTWTINQALQNAYNSDSSPENYENSKNEDSKTKNDNEKTSSTP